MMTLMAKIYYHNASWCKKRLSVGISIDHSDDESELVIPAHVTNFQSADPAGPTYGPCLQFSRFIMMKAQLKAAQASRAYLSDVF